MVFNTVSNGVIMLLGFLNIFGIIGGIGFIAFLLWFLFSKDGKRVCKSVDLSSIPCVLRSCDTCSSRSVCASLMGDDMPDSCAYWEKNEQ